MVFRLSQDIIYHVIQLRTGIRKGPVPSLPFKATWYYTILIKPFAGVTFQVLHQVSNGLVGVQSDQQMCMVRHAVNGQRFVPVAAYDTYQVLLKPFTQRFENQLLTPLHGKN